MIQLADARRIIAAAEKKAAEIGQPMNIAVADAGGNLISHIRMDNAWLGSIDISIKKAWTSRAFDIATKDLAEHSQSGNQFFGIHASNDGKVMIFAGGIPLKKDGKVPGKERNISSRTVFEEEGKSACSAYTGNRRRGEGERNA